MGKSFCKGISYSVTNSGVTLFDHGSYVPQVAWLLGFKGDGLPMGSPVVAFLAKIQSLHFWVVILFLARIHSKNESNTAEKGTTGPFQAWNLI